MLLCFVLESYWFFISVANHSSIYSTLFKPLLTLLAFLINLSVSHLIFSVMVLASFVSSISFGSWNQWSSISEKLSFYKLHNKRGWQIWWDKEFQSGSMGTLLAVLLILQLLSELSISFRRYQRRLSMLQVMRRPPWNRQLTHRNASNTIIIIITSINVHRILSN